MIIQIDGNTEDGAKLIAARDQRMLKRPESSREQYSDFSATLPLKDRTVTLIGHTDDSKQTVGNKTAKEIAEHIAERYQNNKAALEEVFLIACESGVDSEEPGVFWGTYKNSSFAQQLADELQKSGFNNVKVYAARPPENAHAVRVAIDTNGMTVGSVSAIAYMNEETTSYHDDKERRGKLPENYKTDKIMKSDMTKDHQSTFRDAFAPYVAQTNSIALSSAPDTNIRNITASVDESHYRDKLLEKDGVIMRIINAILGREIHTHLAKQLQIIKEEEQPVLNKLETIKNQIKKQVNSDANSFINQTKIAVQTTAIFWGNIWGGSQPKTETSTTNSNNMLDDFKSYLNINNEATWQEKQVAWNIVKKHDSQLKQHTSYHPFYTKINQLHEEVEQIHKKTSAIKTELDTIIDNYLTKIKDKDNDIHNAKRAVISAVKTYLNDPSQKNWDSVQTQTQSPKNADWNKGLFSQVRDIHQKLEIFEEQIRPTLR